MSTRYKIAVVDDHALVRRGICETLEDEPDFNVVGEGACADDGVRITRETTPDLIFLDVNMPGGGIEAAGRVRAVAPAVKIAMFSFRQDLEIVKAAMAAGATGYVVKGISGPALVAVARRMLAGELCIDPELTKRLANIEAT